MNDTVIEKAKKKISSWKKEDYIVLLLIGVLLVIIALPSEKSTDKKEKTGVIEETVKGESDRSVNTAGNTERKEQTDTDTYVANLERKTEEILSGMEGAGKVKVMITVADCGQEVIEKDREISSADLEEADNAGGTRKSLEQGQREEVVYMRDRDGNETPYVVQKKLPEITGVVVMAQGAGNRAVKENIIGAVEVLFNLNEHKIKVIKMKS